MEQLGTDKNDRTAPVPAILDALENANEIHVFLQSEMERIRTERQKIAERQKEVEVFIRSLENMQETLLGLIKNSDTAPSALEIINNLF